LLEERRMKEQLAAEQTQIDKINQWNNIKNDWVTLTDEKIKTNNVRRRFQTLLRQNEEDIEERRQRYVLFIIFWEINCFGFGKNTLSFT